MNKRSFTLIELLAVMGMITILAGLLFVVVGPIKNQARKAKALQDMNNLKIALRSYYNEYGSWPDTSGKNWTDFSSMLNGGINPYTGLTGPAWATANNPRAIRFMEFKITSLNTNADFLDPWQMPYIVLLDNGAMNAAIGKPTLKDVTAEDNQVTNPSGGNAIQSQIAIYSFGQNKTDNNGASGSDDVISWSN